ncbi:MAG TPA: FG-GAP-like repeat-containing protein [Tepidisphaeraceae bacterium]|nr:FG-GAP-like repeat-containing protein [Tepidisphaeraceae bacterium]
MFHSHGSEARMRNRGFSPRTFWRCRASFVAESLERRVLLSAPVAFQALQTFAAGGNPSDLTTADLNGDGKPDLAVAEATGVSILLGNGNGTFQAPITFASATSPNVPANVVAADFNGDGKQDLAFGGAGSTRAIGVLLGNGNGTFETLQTFGLGASGLIYVAAADLNGDGKVDLLSDVAGGVQVLLGNGNGTFGPPQTFSAGPDPGAIGVADLNGDGKPDFVVADRFDLVVSVFLGNGNGTFQAQNTFAATGTSSPYSVVNSVDIADVNGDGKRDLVVGGQTSSTDVFLGNGNGTFQAAQTVATGPTFDTALADVNADGKLDLIAISLYDDAAVVLPGNGDGTFGPPRAFGVGLNPIGVAVADMNGDGKPDLIVSSENPKAAIGELLGDVPPVVQSIDRDNPVSTVTSDDSVSFTVTFTEPVTGVEASDFTLTLNGPSVSGPIVVTPGSSSIYTVTVNAISGSGTLGLNVVIDNGTITDLAGNPLAKSTGTAVFQITQTLIVGAGPSSLATADLNGDGTPDLVVANSSASSVSVLRHGRWLFSDARDSRRRHGSHLDRHRRSERQWQRRPGNRQLRE